MNIAKALKVKNRLIGKIAKQKEVIHKENSRRNDNTSTVNVLTEYNECVKSINELIDLKTKLSIASIPVFGKIVQLQELKVLINFLKGLPTRDGVEKVAYGSSHVENYVWVADINSMTRDEEIKKIENIINILQDEIDEFNAITSV